MPTKQDPGTVRETRATDSGAIHPWGGNVPTTLSSNSARARRGGAQRPHTRRGAGAATRARARQRGLSRGNRMGRRPSGSASARPRPPRRRRRRIRRRRRRWPTGGGREGRSAGGSRLRRPPGNRISLRRKLDGGRRPAAGKCCSRRGGAVPMVSQLPALPERRGGGKGWGEPGVTWGHLRPHTTPPPPTMPHTSSPTPASASTSSPTACRSACRRSSRPASHTPTSLRAAGPPQP